jgi:hypothetical protein
MYRLLPLLLLLNACEKSDTQDTEAGQILARAIAYHDPDGRWSTFDETIVMGQGDRRDTLTIDLPGDYFHFTNGAEQLTVDGDRCSGDYIDRGTQERTTVADTALDSEACARPRLMRDYHTYLTGLPMKLRDPGTPLEPTVERTEFHGTDYLMLTVNYPKEGGTTETWNFFFNPVTHALGAYQFYRSDKPEGGEYLLLDGEIEVNGIKLIKERAWFYRENDRHLATDVLIEVL